MFFRVYHDNWLFYSDGLGMALGEFFTRLHRAAQSEEPRSHLLHGGLGSFRSLTYLDSVTSGAVVPISPNVTILDVTPSDASLMGIYEAHLYSSRLVSTDGRN